MWHSLRSRRSQCAWWETGEGHTGLRDPKRGRALLPSPGSRDRPKGWQQCVNEGLRGASPTGHAQKTSLSPNREQHKPEPLYGEGGSPTLRRKSQEPSPGLEEKGCVIATLDKTPKSSTLLPPAAPAPSNSESNQPSYLSQTAISSSHSPAQSFQWTPTTWIKPTPWPGLRGGRASRRAWPPPVTPEGPLLGEAALHPHPHVSTGHPVASFQHLPSWSSLANGLPRSATLSPTSPTAALAMQQALVHVYKVSK